MTDKEIIERAKAAEKRTEFGELVHSPISKGVNSAFGIGFIEGMVEYRNSLPEEPHQELYNKLSKMATDALTKETKESWNERLDKKDFRERYKRIAQSESFKKAHEGISIGDAVPVEGEEPVINSDWLTELQEKLDNATPEQLEELWNKYNGVDEEEPVSEDWLDMSKIDCKIQYANIESGIHAHAEDYSFNIESQLFNQLTKEQQELWRKEIEQAVISGGHCGVELARDKRYKENHVTPCLSLCEVGDPEKPPASSRRGRFIVLTIK